MFRTAAELARCIPGVVQLLASMGLRMNFAKSCVVSRLLSRVHGALASFPVVSSSTYLCLPFHIAETDAHLSSALCSRATAASFTNRPHLSVCVAWPAFTHVWHSCHCFLEVVLVCLASHPVQPPALARSPLHSSDVALGWPGSYLLVFGGMHWGSLACGHKHVQNSGIVCSPVGGGFDMFSAWRP